LSAWEPKWDIDFEYGRKGEQLVERLLGEAGPKVEVKHDSMAASTGNLAVEFECNGKPSGISITGAGWWAFVVGGKGEDKIVILAETQRLKDLCRRHYKEENIKRAGDNQQTRVILVPVCSILH